MTAAKKPNPTQKAALDYFHRGWAVIPVKLRGKQPIEKAWQKQRLDEDGVREAFALPRNVGVLLGEASGGLIDVDLDSPEARTIAVHVLPETARFGHPGSPNSHWIYRLKGDA